MDFYIKTTITVLIITGILYFAMYPTTHLAKWAEQKCGGYANALITICGTPTILIVFIWLIRMWLEY